MQQSILYKGQKLEYEIRGQGLPVMLVHGFTEDRRVWDALLSRLENKYRWILPDLPGSGDSAHNAAIHSLEDFADSLSAILEKEKLPAVVLIGHSMGGYISLSFAEKYPDKILGLGLFHSSSYPDSEEKKEARDKSIRFIRKNGAQPFIEQSIPGLYSDEYKAGHPEEIQHQINQYANFSPESLVLYLEAMKQRLATTEVLVTITKPVLFIMGEEDKAVPLKDGLAQCHLPRISYIHILAHTAHMGMIENTLLCRSIVDRFLEDIPH